VFVLVRLFLPSLTFVGEARIQSGASESRLLQDIQQSLAQPGTACRMAVADQYSTVQPSCDNIQSTLENIGLPPATPIALSTIIQSRRANIQCTWHGTGNIPATFTGVGKVYLRLEEVCIIHLQQELVDKVYPGRKTYGKLYLQFWTCWWHSEARSKIPINNYYYSEGKHDRTSKQPTNVKWDVSIPVLPIPFLMSW
jgi:hypothetical protein